MPDMPHSHHGMPYTAFMAELSRKRGVQTYLEVGVGNGTLLADIACNTAIAVDPCSALSTNVSAGKQTLIMHQTTSDAFFASKASVLERPIDLAFLDGMHLFEFLLRDFINTEARSSHRSLIALHDCLPLTIEMTHRSDIKALELTRDTAFPGWWTGDVWKVVAILKKYRPDLRLLCLDCPPTGLVLVTKLDPTSAVLSERYLDIVSEFSAQEDTIDDLKAFFKTLEIIPSQKILKDNDYSLYMMA